MDKYHCDSQLPQIEDDSITMKELSNSLEEIVNTSDIYVIFKPPAMYDLVNKTDTGYPTTDDNIIHEIINNKIEFMSSRNYFKESYIPVNMDEDVLMKPEFSILNEHHIDEIVLKDSRLITSKQKNKSSLSLSNKNEGMMNRYSLEEFTNLVQMYCNECNKISLNKYDAICEDCQSLLFFQCITCNSLYKKLISIHNHIKYECYKGSVFYCNECNFENISKFHLIKHIHNEHANLITIKTFKCSICQKKFKNQNNMLSHERVCSNELILKCKYCQFKSRHSYVLVKHVELKHKKFKAKTHHCPDCGKKYEHLKNLNRHIIKFCGKIFKCDHCNYTINRKYSLAKHIHQNHSELFYKTKFLCSL